MDGFFGGFIEGNVNPAVNAVNWEVLNIFGLNFTSHLNPPQKTSLIITITDIQLQKFAIFDKFRF
jgi:hypothetical protein